MTDFSDLIFLMGAMTIYSLLVVNTNNAFLRNSRVLNSSEIEYGATAFAQDIVDEIRWEMPYDSVNATKIERMDDNSTLYTVNAEVSPVTITGSAKTSKKIVLDITSNYMPNTVTMEYIKTDY